MYIVELREPEPEVQEEEELDEVVAAVPVGLAVEEEEEAEGFPALEVLCEFEVVGAEVAVGGCLAVVEKRVRKMGRVNCFLNGKVVVTVINRVVEVNAPPLVVNMFVAEWVVTWPVKVGVSVRDLVVVVVAPMDVVAAGEVAVAVPLEVVVVE